MIGKDRVKALAAPPAAENKSGSKTRSRREVTSAELFGNSREMYIRHADEVYTLRQTSKGKLILTK